MTANNPLVRPVVIAVATFDQKTTNIVVVEFVLQIALGLRYSAKPYMGMRIVKARHQHLATEIHHYSICTNKRYGIIVRAHKDDFAAFYCNGFGPAAIIVDCINGAVDEDPFCADVCFCGAGRQHCNDQEDESLREFFWVQLATICERP